MMPTAVGASMVRTAGIEPAMMRRVMMRYDVVMVMVTGQKGNGRAVRIQKYRLGGLLQI